MSRGGKRLGAGSKSKWNKGKTKIIRIPEAIADRLLQIANDLDQDKVVVTLKPNQKVVSIDSVTESKQSNLIDLANVPLSHAGGEIAIKLTDLVKKGYEISPKKLSELVNARLSRLNI